MPKDHRRMRSRCLPTVSRDEQFHLQHSKDDAVLYGGIAAAGLFGIVLVVALSKALRKRANSQPMYVPPVEVADEDEDEFDFEDLDDDLDSMLDDVDDLDDVFADL